MAPTRIPANQIIASIVGLLGYLGMYVGGVYKLVPGPSHVQFQVGLIGLILIVSTISLIYLNGLVNGGEYV